MKSKDFEKAKALYARYKELAGEVNGAQASISFTDGRSVTVPMDKNMGAGYIMNERSALKAQLAQLGMEITE